MAVSEKVLKMLDMYYNEGKTMQEIADYFGINKSSVSTSIKRADRRTCPIASNCKNCKASKCIIIPEYRGIINNGEQKKREQYKEIDMEICCICGKTCRDKYYVENKNHEKQYFHISCYNHNTIGHNKQYTQNKKGNTKQ